MTKTTTASVILLLSCSAVARAGTLAWAPVEPYPVKGDCQPISFDQPDAIAVDKADNIYIANETGANAVQEISVTAGTTSTMLSRSAEPIKSGHYFGISLALGPKGDLILAVKQRGTVERLNADGIRTLIAGKPGDRELVDGPASKGRLKAPNAIAIGSDGTIYVADTRTIRRIDPSGSITTLAGDPYAKDPNPRGGPYPVDGKGRHAIFMSPNGVAVGTHGNIYVADGYVGFEEGQGVQVGQIRKVTPGGFVSTVAGTPDTTGWSDSDGVGQNAIFGDVYGIAAASNGLLYVAELYPSSIRRIDPAGDVTTIAARPTVVGKDTGLGAPAGIAVTSNETIYTTDGFGLGEFTQWHLGLVHRVIGGQLETLCRRTNMAK